MVNREHPRAAAARHAKARRLITAIDGLLVASGIDPHADARAVVDALEKFDSRVWAAVAALAQVPPPKTSIALVLEEYRDRALKPIPDEYSWVDSLPEEYAES